MRHVVSAILLAAVAAATAGLTSAAAAAPSPLLLLARNLQASTASCGGPQRKELEQSSRYCNGTAETNTVSFDACCPGGAVTDQSSGAASEPTCRVADTTAPYCSMDGTPACAGVGAEDEMLLNLQLVRAPSGTSCCLSCSCQGDPECTAFSGEKNIEINCDGRRPDTCAFGRSPCRKQRDRSGNRCIYLKDKAYRGQWSSFDEDGSPCQSDYAKSGYPKMTMYQYPGFKFELTTADRGVIRDVSVTMGSNVYTLNSARCFEEGASPSAWTVKRSDGSTGPASTLPDGWIGGPAVLSQMNLGGANANAATIAEWPWRIASGTGVQADIVCVRPLNRDKLSRIDVLSLVELNPGRMNVGGYCTNNVIPRGKATYMRSIRIHDRCTAATLPKLLNTCIELFGNDCRPSSLKRQATAWCGTADLLNTELRGNATECKRRIVPTNNDMKEDTIARNLAWTTLVVQINNAPDVQDAISLIAQFGWRAYLETHTNGLPSTVGGNAAESCIDDVSKYTTNDDAACAQGVSVQYLDPDSAEWTEAFFIPSAKPPCGGQLRIYGDQYPELFTNRVRLSQCDLAEACLTANQCAPAVGFNASVLFDTTFCNTERPSCFNCANALPPAGETPQLCVVEPTSPTPVGQCVTCCAVDDVTEVDPYGGPLCRAVTLPVQRYCNPSDPQFGNLCTVPTLAAANTSLALHLERDQEQISCCATCSTYGDPLGVSFDGTRDKYILCDGRDDTCAFKQGVCADQTDQLGNACAWKSALAGKPQRDVNVNGSPCQPSSYTGASLLVYDIAGVLRVEAALGERAIITGLTVTVPEGVYSLAAKSCFSKSGNSNAGYGWVWTGGDPVDEFFALAKPVVGTHEVAQVVTHLSTGVMLRLKCLRSVTLDKKTVGGERIDVQALIETSEERLGSIGNSSAETQLSGFCATGSMSEKTPQNDNAQHCRQLHVLDAVQICSALASPSCHVDELAAEVTSWCARAALPESTAACVASVFSSDTAELAEQWTDAYCRAVASMRPNGVTVSAFVDTCASEVELEGIDAAVNKWGDGTQKDEYCATSHTAYAPRAAGEGDCTTGLSLQTQNPDTLEWEELFFIPDNFPPCDTPFVIPVTAATLKLFTRRVRVHQCDLDKEACPITNRFDTHCLSNQGFELAYQYSHAANLCPDV